MKLNLVGRQMIKDYLLEKIKFLHNPVDPKDEVDYLMLHCFKVAEKFGEEFQAETEDILNSLLFDANRRGKMIIFPKKELMHHFHLLQPQKSHDHMLQDNPYLLFHHFQLQRREQK